jgi:hypothetical protein
LSSHWGNSFSFSCIDEVCVAAALRKITSNATGLDGIPLIFIKLLLPLILAVLTELFNYILTFSTFHLVWKISSVVTIPKVHSPIEKYDYRPISILPVLAKAFESVMYEQMVHYVSRNGLISSIQLGHRTATAIARVSDDIRLNMESNQPTILVLIDFSKAFDSVCHGLFILKLRQRFGFHATAAALVSSYLFLRYQKVSCGDDVSPLALAPLAVGVPQGSPISSLCFFSVY